MVHRKRSFENYNLKGVKRSCPILRPSSHHPPDRFTNTTPPGINEGTIIAISVPLGLISLIIAIIAVAFACFGTEAMLRVSRETFVIFVLGHQPKSWNWIHPLSITFFFNV